MEERGPEDRLIGATLGGVYRVDRLIGQGGMGRVYEATHTHLGERYAVKVLSEAREDKPDGVERFLREAKAATRIDNDHIVQVVNFDTHDEHGVFLVMEMLDGEDLASRIARGPIPIDEAVSLAVQTADALQAAHDAGIVHRDLKPENIFITRRQERDFIKVLDFGISKIKSPDHQDVKLTATDQLLGTPLYISPELARGVSVVDHRTDIYALGVILYEMITGRPPFEGQNHFQLLYKHGNEAPEPPSAWQPGANIPSNVEAAILQALEKEPAARFSSMRAFAEALEAAPLEPKTKKRAPLFLLIGIITVALGFLLIPRPEEDDGEPAPSLVTPTLQAVAPADSLGAESPPLDPPPSQPTAASDGAPSTPAPNAREPNRVALSKVALRSTPPGASVTLDGERRGITPLSLELPRGTEATLRFTLEGHRPRQITFVVEDDRTVDITLRRKARRPTPPIKQDF
ncbi:MAG: serine/threonine-protein kinase [Myxococcota bacterium]